MRCDLGTLDSGERSLPFGLFVLSNPFLHVLSYFMCANSKGRGKTAQMCRIAWAFAGRLCEKSITSWGGSNAEQMLQNSASDQGWPCCLKIGRMPRLIWVFVGRTCHFCWFCHAVAHTNKTLLTWKMDKTEKSSCVKWVWRTKHPTNSKLSCLFQCFNLFLVALFNSIQPGGMVDGQEGGLFGSPPDGITVTTNAQLFDDTNPNLQTTTGLHIPVQLIPTACENVPSSPEKVFWHNVKYSMPIF